MLKGVSKKSLFLSLGVVTCVVIGGCSSSKEREAAANMLEEARVCLDGGRYGDALAIVDSLPVLYPGETDARRSAMMLRPLIIEHATMCEIEQCDSLITSARERYRQAKEAMKKVENPELVEGYWVAVKGSGQPLMDRTGIEARVSDDGEFYVVSEVNAAGNLHHSSITLSLPSGENASSGMVPYDGELNYRLNGSETVTFSWENVDSLGRFAVSHSGEAMTLTFCGDNGASKKIKLSPDEVSAIASAYEMASAQREGKNLMASRQLLERKLALARDQQKRMENKLD